MVKAGVTGEPGALSVIFGQILGDAFREESVASDLGQEFYITRNYFKLHACSRWNHAPVEAMTAIMARTPIPIGDVERVTVWTYNPATRLSWNDPPNGYGAKHSIPYNVAVRLVRGTNDLEAYAGETVSDPDVRAMTRKVEIREDPELTAMLPDVKPARVEVKLRDGRVLSELVQRPRGGFDNPLTEEELAKKFRRLAGMFLPGSSVKRLEKELATLPDLDDITRLRPLLQGESLF
jgi:2-methylcitrate dehydratase PrpD